MANKELYEAIAELNKQKAAESVQKEKVKAAAEKVRQLKHVDKRRK